MAELCTIQPQYNTNLLPLLPFTQRLDFCLLTLATFIFFLFLFFPLCQFYLQVRFCLSQNDLLVLIRCGFIKNFGKDICQSSLFSFDFFRSLNFCFIFTNSKFCTFKNRKILYLIVVHRWTQIITVSLVQHLQAYIISDPISRWVLARIFKMSIYNCNHKISTHAN